MSLTSDKELFAIFENEDITENNIDTVIYRSLLIKREVVEKDEKESGLRKILNFGHTLAHAIESENNMRELYHGECVALGMLPMCDKQLRPRIEAILKKLNLPTEINCNSDVLIEAIKHDKKMSGDKITVIFVPEVGKFEMRTIPFNDLKGMI